MRGGQLESTPPAAQPAHRVDTRDMLEVHRVLRREFGATPALIRATPPGGVRRAQAIAGHIRLMSQLLAIHHSEEDRQLWPRLTERAAGQIGPLVALMETQHDQIHQASTALTGLLPAWTATATPAGSDHLAEAAGRLCAVLGEHLAIEEERILPLAARHLTDAEWARLGADGFAQVPKRQLPLIVGMLMYQGDPEVINSMLAHAPAPARLILPALAPRAYARYARRIHLTPAP